MRNHQNTGIAIALACIDDAYIQLVVSLGGAAIVRRLDSPRWSPCLNYQHMISFLRW